jgi:sulfur relay (sulfurtransferase) complex TusBCD TusD component (DsrE family)
MSEPGSRPLVDLNALVTAEAWLDSQFKSDLETDTQAAMQRFAEKHGIELRACSTAW